MARLPSRLQPWWPLAKRVHRLLSFVSGLVGRRTRWMFGERAVPARGTTTIEQTRSLAPAHVTIHRGPEPGEAIRRDGPVGSPADHWVFERRARLDVPPRYCLEIESGLTLGDYGATIAPGGILDYETSEYFGISGWREHPLYLRRRLPEIEEVEGTVAALATRGGSGNYYHFLTDVLPRLGVVEEILPDRRVDAFYVPAAAYQRTLLGLVGIDDDRIIPAGHHRAVRAQRLVVPNLTNPSEIAPPWTVRWLRSRLRPQSPAATPQRLYVTRGQVPNTRRLDREDEIMEGLTQRGFVRVEPAGLSPQEQIDLFASAEVVVAPHGAALTNLLFAPQGAKVLELFAPDYVNACYWSICEAIGDIDYRYLVAPGAENHGPGDPMNQILADIVIDPAVVLAAVDDLIRG